MVSFCTSLWVKTVALIWIPPGRRMQMRVDSTPFFFFSFVNNFFCFSLQVGVGVEACVRVSESGEFWAKKDYSSN